MLRISFVLLVFVAATMFSNSSSAGAEPLFPDCERVSSSLSIVGGDSFEAIDCNFLDSYITISMANRPHSTSGEFSLRVIGGVVAAGDDMGLSFITEFEAADATLNVPHHIQIRGITFGNDAVLRFTGALPPRSSLEITNNTFFLTQRNVHSLGLGSDQANLIAAITIESVASSTSIVVESSSQFVIANNSASASIAASTDTKIALLSIQTNLTVRDHSQVSLTRNVLANAYQPNGHVRCITWHTNAVFYLFVSNRSSVSISGNRIESASAMRGMLVAFLYGNKGLEVNVSYGSLIETRDNSIVSSNLTKGGATVINWNCESALMFLTIVHGSTFISERNQISGSFISGGGAYGVHLLAVESRILVSNLSSFTANNNSIRRTAASSGFRVVGVYSYGFSRIEIADSSTFSAHNNSLSEARANGNSYAVLFYQQSTGHSTLAVYRSAHISLRYNSIREAIAYGGGVFAANFQSAGSITVSIDIASSVSLSNNIISKSFSNSTSIRTATIHSAKFLSILATSNSALRFYSNSLINSTIDAAANSNGYACVVFAINVLSIYVSAQSEVSFVDNLVSDSMFIGGFVSVVYLSCAEGIAVTLSGGSTMVVSNITALRITSYRLIFGFATSTISSIAILSNSALVVDNVSILEPLSINLLTAVHFTVSDSLLLTGSSRFAITNCTVIAVSDTICSSILIARLYIANIMMLDASDIIIADNILEVHTHGEVKNTNTSASLALLRELSELAGTMWIGSGCRLIFEHNRMNISSGAYASLIKISLTLTIDNATVSMRFNSFIASALREDHGRTLAGLTIDAPITMADTGSHLTIDDNIFTHEIASDRCPMVYLAVAEVECTQGCAISISNNIVMYTTTNQSTLVSAAASSCPWLLFQSLLSVRYFAVTSNSVVTMIPVQVQMVILMVAVSGFASISQNRISYSPRTTFATAVSDVIDITLSQLDGGVIMEGNSTLRIERNVFDLLGANNATMPETTTNLILAKATSVTLGQGCRVLACNNMFFAKRIVAPALALLPMNYYSGPLQPEICESETPSVSPTGSLPSPSHSTSTTISLSKSDTKSLANCSYHEVCEGIRVHYFSTSKLGTLSYQSLERELNSSVLTANTCENDDYEPTMTTTTTEIPRDLLGRGLRLPLDGYLANSTISTIIFERNTNVGIELPSAATVQFGTVLVSWRGNDSSVSVVPQPISSHFIQLLSYRTQQYVNQQQPDTVLTVAEIDIAVATATSHPLNASFVKAALFSITINSSCRGHSNEKSHLYSSGQSSVIFTRVVALEVPIELPGPAKIQGVVPKGVSTAIGVASVTFGAVAVPIGAMQQGVALALVRMAQCDEDPLNGEELDFLTHPLHFPIGTGDAAYARGAVIGNLLVIPILWSILGYFVVPFLVSYATQKPLTISRVFVGWPGVAATPFAILSEGTAMASVGLLSLAKKSAGDAVLGCFGLIVLLVVLLLWFKALWVVGHQSSRTLRCQRTNRAGLVRLIQARYEWTLEKRTQQIQTLDGDIELEEVMDDIEDLKGSQLVLYGKPQSRHAPDNDTSQPQLLLVRLPLIGDSWFLWSSSLACLFSLFVGVTEGLPISDFNVCRLRWGLACVCSIAQTAVVVFTSTVPMETTLLGLTGLLSCTLIVLISMSTFSPSDSDNGNGNATYASALSSVGAISAVAGIALMVVGILDTMLKVWTERIRSTTTPKKKKNSRRSESSERASNDSVLLDYEELLLHQDPESLAEPGFNTASNEETDEVEDDLHLHLAPPAQLSAHWVSVLEEAEEVAERMAAKARADRSLMVVSQITSSSL